MDVTARPPSLTCSTSSADDSFSHFLLRGGRKYLRDAPDYPLPVDLTELHRQNVRLMLLIQVFGGPFCSKPNNPPKRILDIGCGSGLWVSYCHEYLKKQGHENVSFVGLDIAPIAPDLRKQGINWQYVQHDLRKPPMPFELNSFDLIFVNDGMITLNASSEALIDPFGQLKKYLKPGGVVEVWETDFIFRCLLPQHQNAPDATGPDVEQARKTATYTISQTALFSSAKNPYLQSCNTWLEAGFQKLGLVTAPCASWGYCFTADEDNCKNGLSRRVAIPLSVIDWERQNDIHQQSPNPETGAQGLQAGGKQSVSKKRPPRDKINNRPWTQDQAAVRQTALHITIGLIESLEPLLQEQSGMSWDEWYRWWSNMKTNLLKDEGTATGECLEAAAWWIRK